jgi:murein L,D-transpeptidase YafK
MVMQWVEAWSRRDAAAYLSFYAADFNLPEGMQRGNWEAQRQSRLRKYRSIEVTLKNLKISYPDGDAASVRFTQDFQADSYTENGTQKELRLKNIQGRWFIVSEKNSPD